MNDEIREILDKLKDTADTSFFAVCSSQEELDKMPKSITKILSIPSKDAKILLDYITNLQQEIQKKEAMYDSLAVDYRLAQEENERLKEENKQIFSKVNDDELLISNAMNYAEAQDYKSRVEKAVEYIKLYASYDNNFCLDYHELNNLLNILQNGSDASVKD